MCGKQQGVYVEIFRVVHRIKFRIVRITGNDGAEKGRVKCGWRSQRHLVGTGGSFEQLSVVVCGSLGV